MESTDLPAHSQGEPPALNLSETGPRIPRDPLKHLTLWAVAAALIAGVVAWAGGEATHDFYQPSKEAAGQPYAFAQLNKEKDISDGRNAAVAYGLLGAFTGLALGLIGGLSTRSARNAMAGGLTGLILGGLAPALVAPWVVPYHRHLYWPETPDLKLPIMVHGAMWCALGLAAGIAFAIGLGDRRRIAQAAIGGLIGALVATVLFDAVGAIAFPHSRADLPIAETMSLRLISRLFVAAGVALGAIWAIREKPRKVVPPPLSA